MERKLFCTLKVQYYYYKKHLPQELSTIAHTPQVIRCCSQRSNPAASGGKSQLGHLPSSHFPSYTQSLQKWYQELCLFF